MIDYKGIGSRIRLYRIQRGFSQEELAERARLSRVYVGYIERGERVLSVESLVNIANALNVSSDELLSGNLFVSHSKFSAIEISILDDCSREELDILLQSLQLLRDILRKYKITR